MLEHFHFSQLLLACVRLLPLLGRQRVDVVQPGSLVLAVRAVCQIAVFLSLLLDFITDDFLHVLLDLVSQNGLSLLI